MSKFVAGLVAMIVFVLATFALASLSGITISILWSWFVVPMGVKALSIPHAIGVSLLVRATIGFGSTSKEDNPVVTCVLVNIFAMGFGWMVHAFM